VNHPLIAGFEADAPVGWRGGRPIRAAQFCAAALRLAEALPSKRFVLNLCDDRLNFMLVFAAALLARQVSLLPQSRAQASLRELHANYPESYCIADGSSLPAGLPAMLVPPWPAPDTAPGIPAIPSEQIAITAFTSGTTGRPQPQTRTWGSLVVAAQILNRRLALAAGRACVLGTIPPQHMYGFETTVMLPLQNGASIHPGRPLLPGDVAAALEEIPGERWLATTPAHLRPCIAGGTRVPRLKGVLSATMPLSPELATHARRLWEAPIHEIYGCTETGIVALRSPVAGEHWKVTDGLRLQQRGDETWVSGGQLERETRLPDRISLASETEFSLEGRPGDMVKVAGKRASLEALNQELLRVHGVHDGAFFLPEASRATSPRLAAVVVAPSLNRAAILRALRERIDPAFLPRPLLILDALPRTAVGKLPQEALAALERAQRRGNRSA
jgi:acyl-coenzyme A synthetase/AMP-(fatty) acid ligase